MATVVVLEPPARHIGFVGQLGLLGEAVVGGRIAAALARLGRAVRMPVGMAGGSSISVPSCDGHVVSSLVGRFVVATWLS